MLLLKIKIIFTYMSSSSNINWPQTKPGLSPKRPLPVNLDAEPAPSPLRARRMGEVLEDEMKVDSSGSPLQLTGINEKDSAIIGTAMAQLSSAKGGVLTPAEVAVIGYQVGLEKGQKGRKRCDCSVKIAHWKDIVSYWRRRYRLLYLQSRKRQYTRGYQRRQKHYIRNRYYRGGRY